MFRDDFNSLSTSKFIVLFGRFTVLKLFTSADEYFNKCLTFFYMVIEGKVTNDCGHKYAKYYTLKHL